MEKIDAEIKPELLPRNSSVPILPMIPFQAWRPERSEGQGEGRGGSRESSDVLRHLQDIFQGGTSKDEKCLFVWWQDTGDLQSDTDDFWDVDRVLRSRHQHDYAREKERSSCHEDRELDESSFLPMDTLPKWPTAFPQNSSVNGMDTCWAEAWFSSQPPQPSASISSRSPSLSPLLVSLLLLPLSYLTHGTSEDPFCICSSHILVTSRRHILLLCIFHYSCPFSQTHSFP